MINGQQQRCVQHHGVGRRVNRPHTEHNERQRREDLERANASLRQRHRYSKVRKGDDEQHRTGQQPLAAEVRVEVEPQRDGVVRDALRNPHGHRQDSHFRKAVGPVQPLEPVDEALAEGVDEGAEARWQVESSREQVAHGQEPLWMQRRQDDDREPADERHDHDGRSRPHGDVDGVPYTLRQPREREEEERGEQEQQHEQAVEHALNDDRRQRRSAADRLAAREVVAADELPRAQRQDVVGHVPDYDHRV